MKAMLKEVLNRIIRIEETQLKLLSLLQDKTIDVQAPIFNDLPNQGKSQKELKKLAEKEKSKRFEEEFLLYFLNKEEIKWKFNLVATPKSNRVLEYLKTMDPTVFDGLKRNK
ncbi:hypothetical protein SAMN04487989_10181 [Bizionia echini]|uniref:Uncharacterized protein n=1 Tax=Bizionia echini TaxID=649333 RepID=A0A1I4YLS1_9FLAO|nr:hypothetical protein [Bizionia echini]SFN38519.1 hypothetical protein SAMN04487989_10181 [Bizionia echini]